MAAAVAMAEAVAATTGVRATLKWPNDLLVGDRKLAGILAEAAGDAVVVGIGVNVDWPEIPDELEGIATACNLEGGRPTTREELLDAFLARLRGRASADLDATRRRVPRRGSATIGRRCGSSGPTRHARRDRDRTSTDAAGCSSTSTARSRRSRPATSSTSATA